MAAPASADKPPTTPPSLEATPASIDAAPATLNATPPVEAPATPENSPADPAPTSAPAIPDSPIDIPPGAIDAPSDTVDVPSGAMALPAALPAAGPLLAPVASLAGASAAQVDLSGTAASGGTGTYTYQWYRSGSAGFVPSAATLVAGATALNFTDRSAAPDVPYFYILAASDGISTVYSNQVIGALSIPTRPLNLAYQGGPTLVAYLGSSTWAINQGSGQVPNLIDGDLRTTFPSANLTTFNGAVSGTTTSNFLPGQPLNSALKSALQNFTGYKVLRMMIGSNDAYFGQTLSGWLANMQAIIQDALTWPVDKIVLEEIGVRLDGGNNVLDLIRQFNAARSSLLGPKVILGTACTFENQALNLSQLSADQVHQTNAGQLTLATNQSTELAGLFTVPSSIDLPTDGASYFVSLDATHTTLRVSAGSAGAPPAWTLPASALSALTFNLLGSNQSITFDLGNGMVNAPLTVSGVAGSHDRIYFSGQAAQSFALNDSQLSFGGCVITYLNFSELHLALGTFSYTGSLSTVELFDIGAQAQVVWS